MATYILKVKLEDSRYCDGCPSCWESKEDEIHFCKERRWTLSSQDETLDHFGQRHHFIRPLGCPLTTQDIESPRKHETLAELQYARAKIARLEATNAHYEKQILGRMK